MHIIDTNLIKQAVYTLCVKANTEYNMSLYNKLYSLYQAATDNNNKIKLANILKNIKLAYDTKRPLCQDTGQVIVFLQIGQNVILSGDNLSDALNSAVESAYIDNYYRKSVVKNAIFDRTNTDTNTPAIIYSEIVPGDEINIKLLIKGAGSENYSTVKMFNPSASEKEIFEFIKESVITAGEKSCPPLVLGIGIGGTLDSAAIMSKKAFFKDTNTLQEDKFINNLRQMLSGFSDCVLDIKLMTSQTHIACLPVALTINCHSCRHFECRILNDKIIYKENPAEFKEIPDTTESLIKISANDADKIKMLKMGDRILLTGEIYTARDAAHKLIDEYYNEHNSFPFEINNKIIFYAGPCPEAKNEIIGPIGPTTSARMDKYCDLLYSNGLLATIGKGERSAGCKEAILKNHGRYFTAQGGIACVLARCVKKTEGVAFEQLGTEAVRKLYVEDMPLTVEI